MDWSGCDFVEVVNGTPMVKGTTVAVTDLRGHLKWNWKLDDIAPFFPEVAPLVIEKVLNYSIERAAMDDETRWDWRGCDLVEQVPGRCSGAWTVRGTRIFADTIPDWYESGYSIKVIMNNYPSLSESMVMALIQYSVAQKLQTY